ncbi:hypothetical protein [Mesorhizobium sp. CN2-181]|uniref:hypothetical protein n=1 Tax=Mesorhizobium yinganensis TaxID=3157707 RepID=UPI0032B84255
MLRYLVSALLISGSAAHAVELHHVDVRTGTDGLSPLSLKLTNASSEAIACSADIAHWYSVELATAPPSAEIRIDLWFDPETGTYSMLNDKRENLPVERLWCGFADRAYVTRSQIVLEPSAQAAERPVRCSGANGRLSCG